MTGPAPEVRLGNDIARQFAHLDPDEAAARVAAHVERFWEARMRNALLDRIERGDPDLAPLVVASAQHLGATPS